MAPINHSWSNNHFKPAANFPLLGLHEIIVIDVKEILWYPIVYALTVNTHKVPCLIVLFSGLPVPKFTLGKS